MMSAGTWIAAFHPVRRKARTAVAIAALLATMGATAVGEESSVAAARELYASAAYDDALKMLDGLLKSTSSVEERRAMGLYRILCLVALGRTGEADRAVEALVTENPLYRPAMDELPPRMRTAFTETRKRVLPSIVQRQYAEAKKAFEHEEFRRAADMFNEVLETLGDPDIAIAASQPPLSDMHVLATGFHDLSLKELELPPLPASVPIIGPPAPIKPMRDYTRTYSAEDRDVAHPGIISQAFPSFPGRITTSAVGVIEVVIDAAGGVESARLLAPVHPQYDQLAVTAAKRWRYQPAMVDGIPVKFVKRVQITLTPGP